jgi:hypothetical protein
MSINIVDNCRKMRGLIIIILIMQFNVALGQDLSRFPKEIQSVFGYIINEEPLEQYDTVVYQFRPRDWEIADIDGDGSTEVFLWIYPHYNTTPTILIYKLNKQNEVFRVKEGLAPGRLIKRNDEYLSFHPVGYGIDFVINKNEHTSDSVLALSFLKNKSSVIRYKSFVHFDSRRGQGGYIDFSNQVNFLDETTCQEFQFSTPDDIIVGKTDATSAKHFLVKVGNEIYKYRIKGITNEGLLRKEVQIFNAPGDFVAFKLDKDGYVKYSDKANILKRLFE